MFVRLKSNMYSLVTVPSTGRIEKAKLKCVNKNVVESIRHIEYINLLFGKGLTFLMMVLVVWLIFIGICWVDVGILTCFHRDMLNQ